MGTIRESIKQWKDDLMLARVKAKKKELERLKKLNQLISQEKLIDNELAKEREEYKTLNNKKEVF